MMHKWYISGKSRRYNDQFESPTVDGILTFPFAVTNIRKILKDYNGYKRVLYIEKPNNSNSLYMIVFTLNGKPYRLKTRDLTEVEGKLEKLPNSTLTKFNKSGYRSFY